LFLLPCHSHLAKRCVLMALGLMALGERFKLLSFQLSCACRTRRQRIETSGLLAQRKPVIDGRTADVKGAVRLRLTQTFVDGTQHPLA
jgi:hypothetical protein